MIKSVGQIIHKNKLKNLNRLDGFNKASLDGIVNTLAYIPAKRKKAFDDLADDSKKAFRIKKFFDELPTFVQLKKRKPMLYSSDICPLCNKDTETNRHLINCSRLNNENLIVCLKARRKLKKLLLKHENKFKYFAELVSELFPFCFTRKVHSELFTAERAYRFASDDRIKFDPFYTYIWNGSVDALDDIIMGVIPIKLLEVVRSYLKKDSKLYAFNILKIWAYQINKLFFNDVWKIRNGLVLEWEETKGISSHMKRKKVTPEKNRADRPKGVIRRNNRILHSGMKKSDSHILDEELYFQVKNLFGLPNFRFKCGHRGLIGLFIYLIGNSGCLFGIIVIPPDD